MKQNWSYRILWWTIPLTFLPLIYGIESEFDLQLHDIYIASKWLHLAFLLTLILGLLGGVYWLLRKRQLNRVLSGFHTVFTSLSILGLSVVALLQNGSSLVDFDLLQQLSKVSIILLLVLFVVQVVFLFLIVLELLKRSNALVK